MVLGVVEEVTVHGLARNGICENVNECGRNGCMSE